jgi:hypothetical protein
MNGTAVRRVGGRSPCYSVCCIVLLAVSGAFSPVIGGENELFSKGEWSILQSVEYQYRDSSSGDHLLLIEQSGKHLAGVLSTQGGQRLWILLDPDHKPFVKQLPKGDYHINSTEFQRIIAFGEIHPEVQSALKKSVQASPNTK